MDSSAGYSLSMTVCVTGAGGFIGSHLVELLLSQGRSVRALVEYNSNQDLGWLNDIKHPNLEVISGDIRDAGQMRMFTREAETVIHLAALVAIPYSYLAPESYFQTNVLGTLNVLEAARSAGVQRFIHTSTSEVYGTARFTPISEAHPLQAQSPYSASKISADALAFSYWTSFDFPVVIVRPFNTFGPRQSMRAIIPTLIAQAISGRESIKVGSLHPIRDFTFVMDTALGFAAALDGSSQIEGKTINLGTGYGLSISDLVKLIGDVMGRSLEIEFDEKRSRPEKSEVDELVSDNSLARDILNWEPKMIGEAGLRDGIRATAHWLEHYVRSGLIDPEKYAR
jgi:NAD dependent epimerase/dehydratase